MDANREGDGTKAGRLKWVERRYANRRPSTLTMTGMSRLLALLFCLPGSASLFAAEGLLALVDPLDEPEQYCVDVPGFGRRVNLDAPLMAHTCKPGASDELFTRDHPGKGQLFMQAYELCAEAASHSPGAQVRMRRCGSSDLQRFTFGSDGRIRSVNTDLCLAVARGRGQPTGGPSHLRRDLSLEKCDAVDASHSVWKVPAGE